MGKDSQRLYYIDNLRVLACFLVLLTHSTMPAIDFDKEGFWNFGVSFICIPCSDLFITLSGTLLLPICTGYKSFYARRFKRLLPPLVIWSVLGVLLYTVTRGLPMHKALSLIARIPFQPTIGVYWFVYVIAGLYLLAPFISPWLRQASKRQVEFFLALWAVNMTLPWVLHFIPNLTCIFYTNGSYYWTLNYFGGFLGLWLLGWYLNKYPIKIGLNAKWIGLLALVVAYPMAIYFIKINDGDVLPLMGNLQLGSAVEVALLYTVAQNIRLGARMQSIITRIARYSYCIYLTHIYIARELYWGIFDGSSIHIFPRTFLIALLTLATGYLLTYLLSLLPKSKYITGA